MYNTVSEYRTLYAEDVTVTAKIAQKDDDDDDDDT